MKIFRMIRWLLCCLLVCFGYMLVVLGLFILEPAERIKFKYKMIDFYNKEK